MDDDLIMRNMAQPYRPPVANTGILDRLLALFQQHLPRSRYAGENPASTEQTVRPAAHPAVDVLDRIGRSVRGALEPTDEAGMPNAGAAAAYPVGGVISKLGRTLRLPAGVAHFMIPEAREAGALRIRGNAIESAAPFSEISRDNLKRALEFIGEAHPEADLIWVSAKDGDRILDNTGRQLSATPRTVWQQK